MNKLLNLKKYKRFFIAILEKQKISNKCDEKKLYDYFKAIYLPTKYVY